MTSPLPPPLPKTSRSEQVLALAVGLGSAVVTVLVPLRLTKLAFDLVFPKTSDFALDESRPRLLESLLAAPWTTFALPMLCAFALGFLAAWLWERIEAGWAACIRSRAALDRVPLASVSPQLEPGERPWSWTEIDSPSSPKSRIAAPLALVALAQAGILVLFHQDRFHFAWPRLAEQATTGGILALALGSLAAGSLTRPVPGLALAAPGFLLSTLMLLQGHRGAPETLPAWSHPCWLAAIVAAGLGLLYALLPHRPARALLLTSRGLRICDLASGETPGVGALVPVTHLVPVAGHDGVAWSLRDATGTERLAVRPIDPDPARALSGLGRAGSPIEIPGPVPGPGSLALLLPTRAALATVGLFLLGASAALSPCVELLRAFRGFDPKAPRDTWKTFEAGKVIDGFVLPWSFQLVPAVERGDLAAVEEADAALRTLRHGLARSPRELDRLLEDNAKRLAELRPLLASTPRGWEPRTPAGKASFRALVSAGHSDGKRGRYPPEWLREQVVGTEPTSPGLRLVAAASMIQEADAGQAVTTEPAALLAPLRADPAWAPAVAALAPARLPDPVERLLADLAVAYVEAEPFEPILARAASLEGTPLVTASLFASRVAAQPVAPGGEPRVLAEPPADAAGLFALWPELAEARPFRVPDAWRRLPTMTDPELRAFFRSQKDRLRRPLEAGGLADLAVALGLLDPPPVPKP